MDKSVSKDKYNNDIKRENSTGDLVNNHQDIPYVFFGLPKITLAFYA